MIFLWGRQSHSALRPLRAAQAAECARIHAVGFAHSWAQNEFENLIADPNTVSMAALDPINASLRGFALSRIAADEGEILTIVVDPSYRNSGVGRSLLRAHLNQAVAAGAKRIFLEVDADNAAAVALYSRLLFVRVGERRGYYKLPDGKARTALVMRLDLD